MGYVYGGPLALVVGGLLLLWGVCARRRGAVCLLGGGCLVTLGFLFTCTPQSWSVPACGLFAAGTLLAAVLQKWMASV